MEPIRDQLNIDTPELVAIEMPLAGIGSRFIAILIDYLICGAFLLLLIIIAVIIIPALHLFSKVSANWAAGIFFLIIFLIQWGYFSLFEAFNSGRTPGKHAAKIRVIHESGRGINFLESLARNLLRAIDWLPGFYAVGVVAMFASKRHQRLGDMVAGTLVVRDRNVEELQWSGTSSRTITGPAFTASSPIRPPGSPHAGSGLWGGPPHLAITLPAPALAKLSVTDLEVLEGFFSRRLDMDLATRSSLANRIATALCAKSGLEIAPGASVETFLEAVAHQLREIGRMR
jgi:uncharacterized RDD family membrane protein YckC